MELFSTSNKGRETYRVEVEYSLLWESALGIAAITNKSLIQTLEQPQGYWETIKASLSEEMIEHLEYVEKNNTWKALLQLLHASGTTDLKTFRSYLKNLSDEEIRYLCIPYIGQDKQDLREKAASGAGEAIDQLKDFTSNNPFFPTYIEFICKVGADELKSHLAGVMAGWFETVIKPQEEELHAMLQRDVEDKQRMMKKLGSEPFVEWATNGISYLPEPSVYKVLLIPQYTYRPWNVEADLEGVKVFYYPVANESLHPKDNYIPNQMLVLKYKALGDEVRLKIMKMLSEQPRSLQELTTELQMGKTTVHHHLKILKSARLIAAEKSGYYVQEQALASLPKEMDQYLGHL
ncbi:regulatory protein, arsR family [Thalassobacillus cyri]|uniref:Regulatory protein, arsR family n=1 Tax=Thalassobacillus cyri TaxID=571932 RepID=A0A1H4ENH2_9BACI|nr:metalloregulator ArsR/SmtB family transcription factor [Thalassobacillus cyri]SEA86447.1 regulatory protein, arsR family [Thalassobacillus cyri]